MGSLLRTANRQAFDIARVGYDGGGAHPVALLTASSLPLASGVREGPHGRYGERSCAKRALLFGPTTRPALRIELLGHRDDLLKVELGQDSKGIKPRQAAPLDDLSEGTSRVDAR